MSTPFPDPLNGAANVVEIKPRRPPLHRRNARFFDIAQFSNRARVDSTDFTNINAPNLSPLQEGMPDYFSDIRFLDRSQIRPDFDGRSFPGSLLRWKEDAIGDRLEEYRYPTYGDDPVNLEIEGILKHQAAVIHNALSLSREERALFANKGGTSDDQDSSQDATIVQVFGGKDYLAYSYQRSRYPPPPPENSPASSPAQSIQDGSDYFPSMYMFEDILKDSMYLRTPELSAGPLRDFIANPATWIETPNNRRLRHEREKRDCRPDFNSEFFPSQKRVDELLEDSKELRTANGLKH